MPMPQTSSPNRIDGPSDLGAALVELQRNPLPLATLPTPKAWPTSSAAAGTLPPGWRREPPDSYSQLRERPNWLPFREVLRRDVWPVYVWGPVGTGKSFLAARAFVAFAGTAKFLRWCDFTGDAMSLEKEGEIIRWQNGRCIEVNQASFWRVIETLGLLVIDEIGTGSHHETIKQWRDEIFWKLLEIRKGLPLLLTGNIPPMELHHQFDVRIESRICEGQFYEVSGRDQRLNGIGERVHQAGHPA